MVAKILVNCLLFLLALLLAYFSLRGWLKSKCLWYIISTVAAIFSGLAIWLSWVDGITLLVCAALLFGLGELFKKK
ncbi:MAG: hypothetical protein ABSA01_06335 [Anaerolineales bacterium]